MFTIFSLPKPFIEPHICVIQENAINSWCNLVGVETILCGSDLGIKQICDKYSIQHIPDLECTKSGTPLLSSAFNLVQARARHDIIVYANADIIVMQDFLKIFNFLPKEDFLIVGRRWDIPVTKLLNFSKDGSGEEELEKILKLSGRLHQPTGSDYFIFKKNTFKNIPRFAVGRVGWDNWMLQEALTKEILLIDASPLVKVIHQNHDYNHKLGIGLQEDKYNIYLTGLTRFLPTLRNIKYQMTSQGLRRQIVFFVNFRQIMKKNIYYIFIKLPQKIWDEITYHKNP